MGTSEWSFGNWKTMVGNDSVFVATSHYKNPLSVKATCCSLCSVEVNDAVPTMTTRYSLSLSDSVPAAELLYQLNLSLN